MKADSTFFWSPIGMLLYFLLELYVFWELLSTFIFRASDIFFKILFFEWLTVHFCGTCSFLYIGSWVQLTVYHLSLQLELTKNVTFKMFPNDWVWGQFLRGDLVLRNAINFTNHPTDPLTHWQTDLSTHWSTNSLTCHPQTNNLQSYLPLTY